MRKVVVILMAAGLILACNNKAKDQKNTQNSPKDDYRTNENKENTATTDKSNDGSTTSAVTGWPKTEEDAFVNSCVDKATEGGKDRVIAEKYCKCMLEKMEQEYPDVQKAAQLSTDDISKMMMKYRDGCLNQ